MKKILVFIISFCAFATPSFAKKLNAYISYCTFYSQKDGPFVENYIAFKGNSLEYIKNNNGKFQAKIEVLILFKQNDSIKTFNKYNFISAELEDTNNISSIFHDQQRTLVPNGNYTMEIFLKDANSKQPEITISEEISILYSDNDMQFSGIELIQKAVEIKNSSPTSKSGFEFLPMPINYYPPSINKLMYYVEIYNAKKDLGEESMYLYRAYIEQMQTNQKMKGFLSQKRMTSKDADAMLQEFNILKLPSGEYYLVTEIKDRDNNLKAINKIYFERFNNNEFQNELIDSEYIAAAFVSKIKNIDTLSEYIKCLRPIASILERSFIDKNIKTKNLTLLQQFFLTFWTERNESTPENAWVDYYKQVIKVNTNFSTQIQKGYDTERGRVYLMYGEPNSITSVPHESASYPYEIWHYYKIKNQTNRKFIFCNTDLVSNNYELIHSDVSGEFYNINWKSALLKRNFVTRSLDEQDPDFGWGSKANDFFNSPR